MTAIDMHVEVKKKDVDRALAALAFATSPASYALFHQTLTLRWLVERTTHRFTHQGGPEVDGTWAALSDARRDIRSHAALNPEPPNIATSELMGWILSNKGATVKSGVGATFSYPGAMPRRPSVKAKLQTAQKGKPAGFPMPTGSGGTKPSPSPTPPRPILGLDEVDLIHMLGALELWIAGQMAKVA